VYGDTAPKAYANSIFAALVAIAEEEEEAELAELAPNEATCETEVPEAVADQSDDEIETYGYLCELFAFLVDRAYFAEFEEDASGKGVTLPADTTTELAAEFTDEPAPAAEETQHAAEE